ncbi:probable nuclear receptor-binding protein at C-terminar half [Coccomyxa sp. Obi]|nr:probable nuclear receptor-binding protein at C-terminar half [Coccomyxa sp. Obi]
MRSGCVLEDSTGAVCEGQQRAVAVMECSAILSEQQCAPLHAAACGAVVAILLSALLCVLWFKSSSKRSIAVRQQPKAAPAVEPAAPAADACRAVQLPFPLLQHDERLSVEVSSLLGRGRRSFIFRGKWHGAPVAVKVMRLPLRVQQHPDGAQQHPDGAQPTPVWPAGRHIAHPNLVEFYSYKWTVVTRRKNYVSGCLCFPGSSVPVSLRQALQLAGASAAACMREEKHGELLEVVTVAELCQEGTLRDHIDILYNVGSCPVSGAPSCEGQELSSPGCSECAFSAADQASLDGDYGGADDDVALMPEEAASMMPPIPARLAEMKESAAEGWVAGTDCGIPDNFIHFTGRSKPSELHDSDGELSLKLATLMEVGRGLAFLHASGIVHGNLSSSSVLLRKSTLDRRGFIAKIGHNGNGREPLHAGKSAGAFPGATPADDVYAFGALMVEMVTGESPDCSSDGQAAILEFLRRRLPSAYKLLVRQCLASEPAFRPTMVEVVYSMGVLEEQLKETCALSEVDILFSMFNDQGPPTPPPLGKGTPLWQRPLWSPTSPPTSPKGPPSMCPHLASIDALFSGPLMSRRMPQLGAVTARLTHQSTPLDSNPQDYHKHF